MQHRDTHSAITIHCRRTPLATAARAALLQAALACGALAAFGWPADAHAQAASAGQEAARSYGIPAGPLDAVLARFAGEAGILLAGNTAQVQGRTSPGLQGRYGVPDGLAALLAGTGLQAFRQADGSYALRPAPAVQRAGESAPPAVAATGEAALPAVTVSGQGVRDGTTEGSGSYRATFTRTATGLDLSPRETPQTITVVTRQQMDDAAMTSVDDALKVASGIAVVDMGLGGSNYYSRGFQMQSQFDGVAAPGYVGAFGGVLTPDSAFMDRVEVLQGAAGLLTGAGQPGGTINMIRKRPTESFQAQADVQLGSWNARRVVGDVSGPLVESGRIRGRLVALADNSDSFTDYVYRNRRAVYGIAEADLAPGTTLDASIQYQKDTGRNHFGVPFAGDGSDAGLPRSFFASDAQNRSERDFTTYTLGLSQQLARDWRLKASYSRQDGAADRRYYSIFNTGALDVATGDGLTMRRMRSYDETTRSDVLDVQASGPFQLLGRQHELALGLNGAVNRKDTAATGWASTSAVNIHTFSPEALGEVPAGGNPSSSDAKTTQWGMYGVARWSLADSLRLITGVRIGNYKNENVLTGQVAPKETGVVTPYGGLIYDINAQYSAYVSYSDVFNPQTNKSADGSVLKPVVGANYEAGIKGELLDRRLNVSAAVYRLEQSNLAQRDDSIPVDPGNACGGTCYTAAGKVVSQGVDLGIQGQVGSGLNLAAGYTYTSAEYAAGTQKGQRYRTEQPRHSLRLAASYRLPGTGWTLGGNVAATSKAYLSSTSATDPWTIRQGGLVLLGLNAKYRIGPKTQVTMAVSNLTDRSYRSLYARNYSPFGEPRKFAVSLRHQF